MLKRLLILLVGLVLLAAGGYYGWGRLQETVRVDPPQLVTVKRGLFVHEVLERGSIDSARNTDITCQVESQAAGNNITIIWVIPEGSLVEEGDLLVELDASTLRENVESQEINVLSAQAEWSRASASLKSSKIQLQEYREGVFEQDRTAIENRIFSAEENLRTLENDIFYYKRLLERDYVTQAHVDTALIELEKAHNTLKLEKLNRDVLEKYTKDRREIQFQAAIATDEAQVTSAERIFLNRTNRLNYLKDQLERCKIYAPRPGQVVYYVPPRMGNDDLLIREGLRVVERQVLLQLPDPSQMQVRGLVNEANVRLVKPGQKATIRLEAFQNQVFEGVVRTVSDFPEQQGFMGGQSMSKEYLTIVTVLNPPVGIKVGLTAEAKIVVNEIPDALVLPMQAIFEYGGIMYAVTYQDGKWDKLEVKTGPANDKEVVILEGLNEGDKVVLGARAHQSKIDLPRLAQGPGRNGGMIQQDAGSQQSPRSQGGPPGGGPPGI